MLKRNYYYIIIKLSFCKIYMCEWIIVFIGTFLIIASTCTRFTTLVTRLDWNLLICICLQPILTNNSILCGYHPIGQIATRKQKFIKVIKFPFDWPWCAVILWITIFSCPTKKSLLFILLDCFPFIYINWSFVGCHVKP